MKDAFAPRYVITDYCLSLIGAMTELATKINATNIAFPLMVRLKTDAINRNAHSSTSIEGNVLSLAQVSAVSQNIPVAADSLQKKEVANYLKALRWIVRNYRVPITEKRLLMLHGMIVEGLISPANAGRYKIKQNYVIDSKKIVVYTPPGPKEAPRMMRQLLSWLNKKRGIHPVIVSAIFHHQCVSVHPFSDGNGRAARAAAQWILYQKKFDPHHILSLDDFYAADRQGYYRTIQQARDLDGDLTHWIEYVAEGVVATLEAVYGRIRSLSASAAVRTVITPKQEELLGLLNAEGVLSSTDIGRRLKVNRARVNQLVAPLLKEGIIQRQGSARATRYYLKK